jgi:CubicO group peptidase (beta-lactamase class C family)
MTTRATGVAAAETWQEAAPLREIGDADGEELRGSYAPEFAPVVRAFSQLYGGRWAGGGALVVRWQGELVVDVWKGYAQTQRVRPWTRDTQSICFSVTKGVAATVIHRLADRGLLGYDEPVATFWPQFAAGGKQDITVRQLLTHRAGLQSLRAVAADASETLDHQLMEARLAAATPDRPGGRPAYHAWTFGWLAAGLARAVTGKGMSELFADELAKPLGIGAGLGLGNAPQGREAVSELVPVLFGVASEPLIRGPLGVVRRLGPISRLADPMLVPGVLKLLSGVPAPILASEAPAINGTFSAAALAELYGAIGDDAMHGTERLFSQRTANELGRVQTRERDEVLGLPMNWRLGYHQALTPPSIGRRAFGHFGMGGSFGCVDPDLDLSMGYVTNRMPSALTPLGRWEPGLLGGVAHRIAARRRGGPSATRIER